MYASKSTYVCIYACVCVRALFLVGIRNVRGGEGFLHIPQNIGVGRPLSSPIYPKLIYLYFLLLLFCLKVTVHEPHELPRPKLDGILVAPGTDTFIKLQRLSVSTAETITIKLHFLIYKILFSKSL